MNGCQHKRNRNRSISLQFRNSAWCIYPWWARNLHSDYQNGECLSALYRLPFFYFGSGKWFVASGSVFSRQLTPPAIRWKQCRRGQRRRRLVEGLSLSQKQHRNKRNWQEKINCRLVEKWLNGRIQGKHIFSFCLSVQEPRPWALKYVVDHHKV